MLLNKAYNESVVEDEIEDRTFEKWCGEKAQKCSQFQFGSIILQLEIYVLIFVRSIHEGNFELLCSSSCEDHPWYFTLDHTYYARWTSVHLHDMISLEQSHPSIYAEFANGNFVVKKSKRSFSTISIDQAHEQNNTIMKGDGGAIGLTENSTALHRWMVSGPEMTRLIGEFQTSDEKKKQSTETCHHKNKLSNNISCCYVKQIKV